MKITVSFSIGTFGLMLFFPPAALCQSATAKAYNDLRDQHAKDVAAAVAPIDRRYKDGLQQILNRATRDGDLDTAVKIKAELETAGDLRNWMEKVTWGWYSGDTRNGNVKLRPGGKVEADGDCTFLAKWEMVTADKFKMFAKDNGYWMYQYNPDAKEAVSIPKEGTKGAGVKILRPDNH